MPSSSKVPVAEPSTRTILLVRRDQPEVTSRMSPSVKPWAAEVATPGLALVIAVIVLAEP